jgi:DSF synthase
MTQMTKALPFALPNYSQSLTHFDLERHALWYYLNVPKAIFSQIALGEILDVHERLKVYLSTRNSDEPEIRYLVQTSAVPNVFALGGDLELFADLICRRDRDRLMAYGRQCIQCIFNNHSSLGSRELTTISLVQGSALGGGFEAALSTNVLIAERSANLGLPEILFNLFAGMGAYSLLSRRIDMARASRFMSSGRQYSAAELYDLGIVDVLAEDGQGVHAVNDFIRRHGRSRNGLLGIQQARQRLAPLLLQELEDVLSIWVETAMHLSERDVRTMEKLVGAQNRLALRLAGATATSGAEEEQAAYAAA